MDDVIASVLPDGLTCVEGVPPAPPSTFDEDYVLPQHFAKPLHALNAHPHDARIVFWEKDHIYTVDDVPVTASVTSVAHKYEKPFVAHEAIRLMKYGRSQAWPRKEYVHEATPVPLGGTWDGTRGALVVFDGQTVAVVQPSAAEGDAIPDHEMRTLLNATKVKRCDVDMFDDDVECYSFDRALTDDEIAAAWKRKGMIASHKGTEAHFQAELAANGLPCRHWEPEVRIFVDFLQKVCVPRGIVMYETEGEKFCLDADLAGSIDLIVYEPSTGLHHIVDHKRSDKLKKDLRGYGKMLAPLNHLDDCKGAAYALQLSIYQFILEREYGMTIGERILVSLHPDQPFTTAVPYLAAEVEFLMEQRMALARARRQVAEELPRFVCAKTGAPLVAAVRTADGLLVTEKAALLHELPCQPAHDVRDAFEAECAKRMPHVALDTARCVAWKKLMPEEGLVPFATAAPVAPGRENFQKR